MTRRKFLAAFAALAAAPAALVALAKRAPAGPTTASEVLLPTMPVSTDPQFRQEMESLYRKCCAGSPSDEPDFIIADSGIHWRREMEIDWSLPKYMRNRGGAR